MLGLKAVASRKREGRSGNNVKPQDIPGFAKWITSEVYIEDKIAQSSLEQLALNMMENVEWINAAMYDILEESEVSIESLGDNKEGQGNNHIDNKIDREPVEKIQDMKLVNDKEETQKHVEDNLILPTTDNSFLLLKSPTRIRDQISSPIQQIRKREIELIKDTTTLILGDDKIKENKTKNNDNDKKHETTENDPVLFNTMNVDDSFDLISKDIRKSFAAKQKNANSIIQEKDIQDKKINEDVKMVDNILKFENKENTTNKILDNINNETNINNNEVKNSKGNFIIDSHDDNSNTNDNNKMKSPEEEIRELSKLIENVNDKFLSDGDDDDDDDDLDIELGKLDKIELYHLNRRSKVAQDYKSPIKFSEMPMIEPLTLESSRKKSIRKTTEKQNSINTNININNNNNNKTKTEKRYSSHSKTVTIFDETNNKTKSSSEYSDRKKFELTPLPNENFGKGDTSLDEPTIKLGRSFKKEWKLEKKNEINETDSNIINANKLIVDQDNSSSGKSIKNDFLTRLMQPTESSKQRIRSSSMSPIKSQKTSRNTSPRSKQIDILNNEDNLLIHNKAEDVKTNNSKDDNSNNNNNKSRNDDNNSIVPVPLTMLGAPNKENESNKNVSPIKKKLPLTKKSLKSSIDYKQLYNDKKLEYNTEIVTNKLFQETLGVKRIISKDSKIPSINSISERGKLKSISKASSKFNQQQGNNIKKVITKDEKKDKYDNNNNNNNNNIGNENININILPNVIPTIKSDDEFDDEYIDDITDKDWTSERNIIRQLKLQKKINPKTIFGPISTVDGDKMFNKKFPPGININWNSKDKLTAVEIHSYEKSMGWI